MNEQRPAGVTMPSVGHADQSRNDRQNNVPAKPRYATMIRANTASPPIVITASLISKRRLLPVCQRGRRHAAGVRVDGGAIRAETRSTRRPIGPYCKPLRGPWTPRVAPDGEVAAGTVAPPGGRAHGGARK